jgi:hypothetical protein
MEKRRADILQQLKAVVTGLPGVILCEEGSNPRAASFRVLCVTEDQGRNAESAMRDVTSRRGYTDQFGMTDRDVIGVVYPI